MMPTSQNSASSRVPCLWASAQLITAMVTPFSPDGECLDIEAIRRITQHLIASQQADALLVNGTTGESPTLTTEEKLLAIETVRSASSTFKTPLLAGVGSNDTRRSVKEAELTAQHGVDGLLLVTPYYNKPTQAGLVAHFEAMAKAVEPLPVMLYNIPGRTVIEILPETAETLVQRCENIVGVKQSVANLDHASEMVTRLDRYGAQVWSGDDSLTLPMMAVGAVGVVSVLAHLAGAPLKGMMRLALQGNGSAAQEIHSAYLQAMRECFFLPNPTVIKTALAQKGLLSPALRLPLLAPDESDLARIQALLSDIEALNAYWTQTPCETTVHADDF